MKLLRRLEDIDPSEVTLCGLPATRKKFLFFKNSMQRLLDTFEGMQGDSDTQKINIKKVNIMDPELKKLLDSYFGEEVSFDTEEFEKAKLSDKALNALKGALNLVNKYKADFPDDLKKAVGVLAKYSSYGYGYPAEKNEDKKNEDKENEKVEKAGKTLSKDTVSKVRSVVKAFNELQNVVKALNDLLPEEDQKKLKKSDAPEGKDADIEFKKALDEVTDIAKKLEGKLEEKDQTIEKLGKDLGEKDKSTSELIKRLETLEKAKGAKKQIEGQDEEDGDGEVKKSDDPWPSFANIGQEE